ncbi:Coenzyme F420 hydrogenase/dehydrogenase, beta subunit C-terminal domain [Rhodococcus sp. SJ-2]
MAKALRTEVEKVVSRGNCSGCGLCAQLSPNISLELNSDGYLRPVWTEREGPSESSIASAEFVNSCPGSLVKARPVGGLARHPILGSFVSIWEAWAVDPEVRYVGSSGGTLTALVSWLLESGQYESSTSVAASQMDPRKSTALQLTTKSEALAAAGSRYAPVGAAAVCSLSGREDSVVVGKPCEASAVRQLTELRGGVSAPLILSFFCAGTPSQHATDGLISDLGIGVEDRVTTLRYRGNGWPGEFFVRTESGATASAAYNESWGKHLGPTTQWRCKICPDGIGESADITAGDFWHADERGYPSFEENDGVSVLIARTERGDRLVRRAIAEGILGARPTNVNEVVAVQPLQVKRRATLAGRTTGAFLAGKRPPRFKGFQLLRIARIAPIASLRSVVGTFLRARRTVEPPT